MNGRGFSQRHRERISGSTSSLKSDPYKVAVERRGFKPSFLVTPDNGEKFMVEMSNSTLTNIKDQQAKNPDLTITVNRSDLESVMGGKATFDDLIAAGKAKFEGDRQPFEQLKGILVQFTPDFEMMPGTKPAKPVTPTLNPFEHPEPADTSGG